MRRTGFFWDERCFWHAAGTYALTVPVGGLVQPLAAGGLPESPETKRRLKNLMDVTGLSEELSCATAEPASRGALERVHPAAYLNRFREMSDAGGGELGLRVPIGAGAFETACLSTGLVIAACDAVLAGRLDNAYALSRPPGHHCLPDRANGFCMLANIAVAIEEMKARGLVDRVAVIDWDVHHGNGTEAIFYHRADVLTLSIHQERNYPLDTGDAGDLGARAGAGANLNIPLPPGAGHAAYLAAFERLVVPRVRAFAPDLILVACGFDASGVDPLSRMLCTAGTFRDMTRATMTLAEDLCGGKLVMAHEGGYSEVHVPFCGHAVLEAMSGSALHAPDPLDARIRGQQPGADMDALVDARLTAQAAALKSHGLLAHS